MENLLPRPFHDFGTRLAAVRRILGRNISLPSEDPGLIDLELQIRKQCVRCSTCNKAGQEDQSIKEPTEAKNTRDASEVLDNEVFHSCGLPKQRLYDRLPDGNLGDENSHEEDPGPECFKVRIGDFAADVLSLSLFATDNQIQPFPALAHPYFRSSACFGSGSYAASLFYHEETLSLPAWTGKNLFRLVGGCV